MMKDKIRPLTSFSHLLAGLLPSFALLVTGPVYAQADTEDRPIEEVYVTATKRESALQTTPIAITAQTAQELRDAGVSTLQGLQLTTPSLIVSENSGQELPIAIRGISSGQQGPGGDSPVAIYLDGVYIGRPLGSMFEFANIERVEVLRGPQGTLYGRNVTGGAINIITRAPADHFSGTGLIRYGSFDEYLVNGAVSGPLTETLSLSVAGSSHRDDGYSTRLSDGTDRNPTDSSTVNVGLRWEPSDNLTVNLRADTSNVMPFPDSRPLSDAFEGHGVSTFPLGTDVIFVNEDSYEEVDSSGVGLTIDWNNGAIGFRSITAYRNYSQDMLIDNDLTEYRVARFNMNLDADQVTQEFNLFNMGDSRISWLAGAYYFDEESDGTYGIQSFLAVPDRDGDGIPENFIVSGTPTHKATSYAVFADFTFSITDQLRLGIGARYSDEEKKFSRYGAAGLEFSTSANAMNPPPQSVPPNTPQALEYDAEDSWDPTTWRVSLDYDFSDTVFGYLSAQEGFKSGGYSFSAGGPITNPSFDPEEITAYEVGLKTGSSRGTFLANFAAFYYDYTGLQIALATDPATRSIFNAASADVKGAELEFAWLPQGNDGLRLTGNVTYLNADYKDFLIDFSAYPTDGAAASQCAGGVFTPGVKTCDLSGNELPRSPKYRFIVAGEYDFNLSDGGTLTPRLQVVHEEPIFYTEQNIPLIGHDGFTVWDARLTWTHPDGNWGFALWGMNLTDERYVAQARPGNIRASFVPGPPFLSQGLAGEAFGTVNRPRAYGIEAFFNFGD